MKLVIKALPNKDILSTVACLLMLALAIIALGEPSTGVATAFLDTQTIR